MSSTLERKNEYKIIGEIKGKGRPRTNFYSKRIYTPITTKRYERLIRSNIPMHKVDGAITIDLECHFKLPKNTSKKKVQELIGKPCMKKPDIDNIEKIYLDALNGWLYEDDKQVYRISATKVWDVEEYVLVKVLSQNDIII